MMNDKLSEKDLQFIRELIYRRAAISLETGKNYLIESRLAILKERKEYDSIEQIFTKIRDEQCEKSTQDVINIMTTNETSFFRDKHPFEALKELVIPGLMAERPGQNLVIWSGACSSGQEPYSIAILLAEFFPHLVRQSKVKILATDLSTDILEQAKAGCFSQVEVNRGLPEAYLVKYFHNDGKHWIINDEIRKLIEFRIFNLNDHWGAIPSLDLVFLRNVMIYFDDTTRTAIFNHLKGKIKNNGFIFLGAGETPPAEQGFLQRQHGAGTFYYKKV